MNKLTYIAPLACLPDLQIFSIEYIVSYYSRVPSMLYG